MWKLKYTNDAKKDLESLRSSKRPTKKKISDLLEIIKKIPITLLVRDLQEICEALYL